MHSSTYYYYLISKKLARLVHNKHLHRVLALAALVLIVVKLPLPELQAQVLGVDTTSVQVEQTTAVSNDIITVAVTQERKSGSARVVGVDYRAVVLDEYFRLHGSPLTGLGSQFVDACDAYGAPEDCTTIPAIAYVETGLCTYLPSQQQKNCWGFGGSGENRIQFASYSEAITYVTSKLVKGYGAKYMQNPEWMEDTYCGKNCNQWGEGVQQQRHVINNLAISMGYAKLF